MITQKVTRRNKGGTKIKQIDYLIGQKNMGWEYRITNDEFYKFSNHKPLSVSISIPKKDLFQRPIIINTKFLNDYIDVEMDTLCNNPQHFGIRDFDYKMIINQNLTDVIQTSKVLLFSKNSKFYDLLQIQETQINQIEGFNKEYNIVRQQQACLLLKENTVLLYRRTYEI